MNGGNVPPPGQDPCLSRRIIPVGAETDVAEVLIAAHAVCAQAGASSVLTAHVATAASELAHNLWLHTLRGGTITLSLVQRGARRGLRIESDDEGPGIADLDLAMSEGYSTAGGLGCGLPGVKRLTDEFSIESAQGSGTRVRALSWLPDKS